MLTQTQRLDIGNAEGKISGQANSAEFRNPYFKGWFSVYSVVKDILCDVTIINPPKQKPAYKAGFIF